MTMTIPQYVEYMKKQCNCSCHRVAGAMHVIPCCDRPAVDARYEKQMDVLGEFVETNPVGRTFLRD